MSSPDPVIRPEPLSSPPPPERAPSDEVLLAALAAGRGHAFDVLVARHASRVQTFLRHLLGDAGAAEDLTQDVFVKVYEKHATRAAEQRFHVWLFRVARNIALDHLRHRRVHTRALDVVAGIARRAPETPPDALLGAELAAAVARGIARLPEPQRAVFLLREREELSYEEIGEVVGCAPKTVSTRLARARAKLRELLSEHGEERA